MFMVTICQLVLGSTATTQHYLDRMRAPHVRQVYSMSSQHKGEGEKSIRRLQQYNNSRTWWGDLLLSRRGDWQNERPLEKNVCPYTDQYLPNDFIRK
ncbi:hypothetical protein GQ44DRAFT_709700 [Phaeosphaeriaceae sp. PMI808]|nr:hypothetical protein GQ44DRAFT_709700 [Phaeosphaeriaceae sp. PMI808]